jgi:hypothetical protein
VLSDKVKQVIHEGNVRRIIIRVEDRASSPSLLIWGVVMWSSHPYRGDGASRR